jgi:hypothetical protein
MWIFFFLSEYTVLPILVYWRVATLHDNFAHCEINVHKSLSGKDLELL